MFDLDQAIYEWRQRLTAARMVVPEAMVEELESHLREEVHTLIDAGLGEDEAFRLACDRLGSAEALAAESTKANAELWARPVTMLAMWVIVGVILAVVLAARRMGNHSTPLLTTHVYCITLGYIGAFFAASLMTGAILLGRIFNLPPDRQRAWLEATRAFTQLSAGLIGAGWLLGMLWARQNWGRLPLQDPRAIAALFAFLGLVCSWRIQRSNRRNPRVKAMACIGSSALVTLAWFGAGLLSAGDRLWSFWPLNLLLAVHFLFFAASLTPGAQTAEA